MIYQLRSFKCPSYSCYFHLWGFGGPAWVREYNSWIYENDHEWTTVTRSPRRMLTGANSVQIGRRPNSTPPTCHTPTFANNPAPISDHKPNSGAMVMIQNSSSPNLAHQPNNLAHNSDIPLQIMAQQPLSAHGQPNHIAHPPTTTNPKK